jgi:hypothetical protein
MARAIFYWCYILFLIVLLNWVAVGKMPRANWDKLNPGERKAIIYLLTDTFFKQTHCGASNFRIILDSEDMTLHAECLGYEWES